MYFETLTESALRLLLAQIDKDRAGTCIEIGVGTYNWYCDLFATAGYRSVAIEPFVAEGFRIRLTLGDIVLLEAAVADRDGEIEVHLSSNRDTNLSSLRSDWWAASRATRAVRAITLASAIKETSITRLTCLKVDVEGAESMIIRQLEELPADLLPEVVVFEWGGAIVPPLPEFETNTMECLRILQRLGYGKILTLDVFSDAHIASLDLPLNPAKYFGADSQAGNAIVLKKPWKFSNGIRQLVSR